jgi:hypothetical protein
MKYKLFLIAGILTPIFYLITLVIYSFFKPNKVGYSISALIYYGAPNKFVFDFLFSIYIILTLIFAVGLLLFFSSYYKLGNYNNFGKLGVGFIMAAGLLGLILILFFPIDPIDSILTTIEKIHIILAVIISLLTMLGVLFFVLLFKKAKLKYLSFYSLISLIIIFISGILADLNAGQEIPLLGLIEKIAIFAFLQWMFTTTIWVLNLKYIDSKELA